MMKVRLSCGHEIPISDMKILVHPNYSNIRAIECTECKRVFIIGWEFYISELEVEVDDECKPVVHLKI